ncbi:MAG: fibrobacter succinogenes major paralogous domain-containing protein, partial [Bacteroidia bacterium]|nr:fibrobacter succinogenes major paralogous domain-containing protein [Bacteroidia bacterium]
LDIISCDTLLLYDVRDGKSYSTVRIGNQCWMAENLNYGTKINGTSAQTNNSTPEKYCYSNNEANCTIYGGLYQWAEIVQYLNGATNTANWIPVPAGNVQGICPTGWHILTDDEYKQMEMFLGMTQSQADAIDYRGTDEGGKLKEIGTTHWTSPNTGATNSSFFTALPGGNTDDFGSFNSVNNSCGWWLATVGGDNSA